MNAQSIGTPWLWVGFIVFVLTMLVLDLRVFNRKVHEVHVREALLWSALWISLSLLFNLGVYFVFGEERAVEFLSGYLIEKALSVDNLFVFIVVFAAFAVPAELQHRVLGWGILGALVMRALFILLGASLLHHFHWISYLFGIFLVLTGIKLLVQRESAARFERNPLLRLFRWLMPAVDTYHGGRFTIVEAGKRYATPLLLVLVTIEVTDIVFAVDSIPAIFGVTTDPFIVFTSNVFAILGMRALYFALATMMGKFHYLKFGLAAVLVFVGGKLLFADIVKVPIATSLIVVVLLIGGGIATSLLFPADRREGRDGRWQGVLIATFATSCLCFVAGTTFTTLYGQAMAGHSRVVSHDVLPSIAQLGAARAGMDTLQRHIAHGVKSKEHIPTDLQALDEALAVYDAFPVSADEARLRSELAIEIEHFRETIQRTDLAAAEGDWELAADLFTRTVEPSARRVDDAILELIELNASEARGAAEKVERTRVLTMRFAVLFDGMSVAVAGLALLLALRTVRRCTTTLAQRADDFETFALRVAHDIRSPLGAPLFALETIALRPPNDSARRSAEAGVRGLKRVVAVVEGLYDFARTHGEPEPGASVDAGVAANGVLDEIQADAERERTTIRAEVEPGIQISCAGGPLAVILSNLVRNAIKHMNGAPLREVTLRIHSKESVARIEVRDSGPGIPVDMRETIFHVGVRGQTHGADGLGLGLATVKKLVEAHHGSIGLESEVGRGSLFWIELPMTRSTKRS